jgi:hypothetical protein
MSLYDAVHGQKRDTTAILILDDAKRGGVLRSAKYAYSTGFDSVYVPLQKTKDEYPRFVVSTDENINHWTMMEYHRNQRASGSRSPLLGEFISMTSNLLKTMYVPVYEPEQVDAIFNELSLSSRNIDTFSMIVSHLLVSNDKRPDDCVSRYRQINPSGRVMMSYEGDLDDIVTMNLLNKTREHDIDTIIVPFGSIDESFVNVLQNRDVKVAVNELRDEKDVKNALDMNVDYVFIRDPKHYIYMSTKERQIDVRKIHASMMFS